MGFQNKKEGVPVVSTLSIGFMIFSGYLFFLFPLGLAVLCSPKREDFLKGNYNRGVVFVLVQPLTRLPFSMPCHPTLVPRFNGEFPL